MRHTDEKCVEQVREQLHGRKWPAVLHLWVLASLILVLPFYLTTVCAHLQTLPNEYRLDIAVTFFMGVSVEIVIGWYVFYVFRTIFTAYNFCGFNRTSHLMLEYHDLLNESEKVD